MYLIPGVIGFVACCLFDINKIKWQSKKLNLLFAVGVALIIFSTCRCMFAGDAPIFPTNWKGSHIIFFIGLILSFAGLIYTLFFALPFENTYIESESVPLINHGVYALCRHPGFWMLTLVYLFLWLFISNRQLFVAFLLYTFCNFIYVYIQDRYIFPLYIKGYNEYKKSVPFLIPNRNSMQNTFKR